MKFRAIIPGALKDGHPVQALFVSRRLAEAWATVMTENYKGNTIEIYEITERLVSTATWKEPAGCEFREPTALGMAPRG